MQVAILVLSALVAAVSGGVVVAPTTLVRAPAHDSAVIKFDRVGGNFAYSSVEAPAYAAVSPVVKTVPTPVAVSYSATPVVVPAAPAPAYRYAAPAVPAPAVVPAPAYRYAAPAVVPAPAVVSAPAVVPAPAYSYAAPAYSYAAPAYPYAAPYSYAYAAAPYYKK